MRFLLVLAQQHPEFRVPELQALADLEGITVDLSDHKLDSPFMHVELESEDEAKRLVQRSILTKAIYKLIASGKNIDEVHEDNKSRSHQFPQYRDVGFKFEFLSFHGKRPREEQAQIMQSFIYMDLLGPIQLKTPECLFTIIEHYEVYNPVPKFMWFTKLVAHGDRNAMDVYDLKKRKFIGTTSFDAELSLVTCNFAKIKKNDIVYDPFSGTGSFPVAAAHYRALVYGTDIDFRALKGYGENFDQYKTGTYFGDAISMDFTHNAFRPDIKFDAIISDPPYGIREGLKVCGAKPEEKAKYEEKASLVIENELAFRRRDYVQPKVAYSFELLLQDILNFAGERLVEGGRLAFWLPLPVVDGVPQFPQHKHLKLLYSCPQHFNKWTRWLLTYERRREGDIGEDKAIELSDFREHYFTRAEHLNLPRRK